MIPHVAFAINTAYHRCIDNTPFYLMFARDPLFRLNIEEVPHTELNRAREGIERVERARELVRDRLEKNRAEAKERYDRVVAKYYKNQTIEVGHVVWSKIDKQPKTKIGNQKSGVCVRKLAPIYVGPFRVVWIRGPVAGLDPIANPGKLRALPLDKLRRCLSVDVPPPLDADEVDRAFPEEEEAGPDDPPHASSMAWDWSDEH